MKHSRRHLYAEALAALDAVTSHLIFPVHQYQAHSVRALVAAESGDFDTARRHARWALEAASAKDSGLPYHRHLGLWRDLDTGIHNRVTQLAGMPSGGSGA